ncbi:baseplate assembly protein [Bacillus phage YungSlug]|nr:baseplate assembly protein [Bacillus phage YungSlug]
MAEYIRHAVVQEDTLQALAQRYLNDTSRWVELSVLNGLDYPFIVNKLRDKETPEYVKAIGEIVLVPSENRDLLEGMQRYEIKDEYDRLLGEDIALFEYSEGINLTSDGQGEMEANNKGDLKTVRGVRNLKQALLMRLSIPLGGLLHHPLYGTGLHDLLGVPNTYDNQQKIRIEIERTIRADKRVKDILIDSFTLEKDTIKVTIKITAIGLEEIINMGFTLGKVGVIEWD